MKLLVFLASQSRYSPPRVGQFVFNNDFGKWLYLGRPLTPKEFNEAAERLIDNQNKHVGRVTVRVVDEPAEPVAVLEAPPARRRGRPPTKNRELLATP